MPPCSTLRYMTCDHRVTALTVERITRNNITLSRGCPTGQMSTFSRDISISSPGYPQTTNPNNTNTKPQQLKEQACTENHSKTTPPRYSTPFVSLSSHPGHDSDVTHYCSKQGCRSVRVREQQSSANCRLAALKGAGRRRRCFPRTPEPTLD